MIPTFWSWSFFGIRLFSDKETKLVYSNGLGQVHLSCPINDVNKRTACKTYLACKIIIRDTKKHRLAKEGAVTHTEKQQ